MSEETTPQQMDQEASLRREMATVQQHNASTSEDVRIWLWVIVGVIVLLAIAGGVVLGFISGRFYNLVTPPGQDAETLLGARLVDRRGEVAFTDLQSGGPADFAGITAGAHLLAIDAQSVRDANHARRMIERYRPDDIVLLTVRQASRIQQFAVALGVYHAHPTIVTIVPITPPPPDPPLPPRQYQSARLGVMYRMLGPDDPFDVEYGALIVAFLAGGTPAQQAGLSPGDIIVRVEGTPLNANMTLSDALSRYSSQGRVNLTIYRAGREQRVTVRFDGQ